MALVVTPALCLVAFGERPPSPTGPSLPARIQATYRRLLGSLLPRGRALAGGVAALCATALGTAYFLGGEFLPDFREGHLVLRDDLRLGLADEPRDLVHRPSIDVFFESVARHITGRGCGVLLTGMGRDGASGLLALRRAAFHTIAQDEHSSVVWGMPRAAVQGGAATEVLPLDAIASRVAQIVGELVK